MKRRILFGKTDEIEEPSLLVGNVIYNGIICRVNGRNKAANGDNDIAKMQIIKAESDPAERKKKKISEARDASRMREYGEREFGGIAPKSEQP